MASLLTFLVIAAAISVANAQQSGAISGRVSNAATGAYLEGARVELQPLARTAFTSRDGRFTFSQVPAGSYDLTTSYTGLDPQTLSVTVAAGETLVQPVTLTAAIYELGEFVVAGEREGSALAIQLQRNAPNVKNVLSADAFGNVADQNIGNFLQRVPGISTIADEGEIYQIQVRGIAADMNAVTIDGTRSADGTTRGSAGRGTEVDKIPADFIESIEVTKAPTPDMDADSIGGSVNLKTKSPFDRTGRVISYKVGASLNLDRETLRPNATLMYSDLLGEEQRLGIMVTGSFNRTHKPRDSAGLQWEHTLETDRPVFYFLQFAGEDQLQHVRVGLGARVDYKLNEENRIFFNTMYSYYEDRLNRRRATMNGVNRRVVDHFDEDGIPRNVQGQPATIMPGWTDTVTETVGHRLRFQRNARVRDTATTNFQVGGESDLTAATLDYSLNYSHSQGNEHRDVSNRDVHDVGFRLDRTRSDRFPEFTQTSGPDFTDPENSVITNFFFLDHEAKDEIWGGQANFRRELDLAIPTSIKTGVRYRAQTRVRDENRREYSYVGPDGVAGLNPATGINDDDIAYFIDETYTHQPIGGLYPNWPFMDLGRVIQDLQTNPHHFVENTLVSTRNSLQNDFEASEDVYAAYLMGETQLGKLSILGGLRAEETRITGVGMVTEVTPEEAARRQEWVGPLTPEEIQRRTEAQFGTQRRNSGGYRDVFPSFHLKYEAVPGLLARASWSTGIGRPNFTNIVPNTNVNHNNETVNINNINLKPQYSDNFDFSLEYYFEPAGLISGGVFLKEISDFIFSDSGGLIPGGPDNGFNGLYEGYELRSNFNGGSARVRGWEVSYQQQFSHLPGFWRGFGVFANYTHLETTGDYGTGAEVTGDELVGFTPRTANFGISYIDYGWTLRAQMNYTSGRLRNFHNNLPQRRYGYAFRQVDLNMRYDFSRRVSVFLDVINLFDVPTSDMYWHIPSRPFRTEKFTTALKFGISGRY